MQTSTVSQATTLPTIISPSDDNTNSSVKQLNQSTTNIPLNQLKILGSTTTVPNANKRSVKEAKDLGKQVEYNLRLNGYTKHEAKVIGKLVKFLKEKTNNDQNKISSERSQQEDHTDLLKGEKQHSKIGFYFKKFINLFKENTPDKTSIDSGLKSLKNILNQSEEGKGLLNEFKGTLKENQEIAFLGLFPDSTDVEKTKYPESIKIGDQTLTLKNVPGDGNCGIWSLLQLMHPEKNYLESLNTNPSQEKEAIVKERQAVANFAKEKGASQDATNRISNPGTYLDTQDFKYAAQYYKKDIVIYINSEGMSYYETYYADGKECNINFDQPSYDKNAHYIYYQNEHFQALSPQNES